MRLVLGNVLSLLLVCGVAQAAPLTAAQTREMVNRLKKDTAATITAACKDKSGRLHRGCRDGLTITKKLEAPIRKQLTKAAADEQANVAAISTINDS